MSPCRGVPTLLPKHDVLDNVGYFPVLLSSSPSQSHYSYSASQQVTDLNSQPTVIAVTPNRNLT